MNINKITEHHSSEHDLNVEYPIGSKPHIVWEHVDGPMLCCHDGAVHWLTLYERLILAIGTTTLEELDEKHCHRGATQS